MNTVEKLRRVSVIIYSLTVYIQWKKGLWAILWARRRKIPVGLSLKTAVYLVR